MKLAALILMACVAIANANDRVVLVEFSTNTSCIPCVDGTIALDKALDSIGRNKFAVIRYHTPAPSTLDPFYQSNKDECEYRANTYGLQSNPVLLLDGTDAGPTDSSWEHTMELVGSNPSTISIALSGKISGRSGAVNVILSAIPAGGEKLFGVVTESGIEFQGMNGEIVHDDVFQHTITGWSGVQPDSLMKTLAFALGTDSSTAPPFIHQWDPDSCRIVVWLQNPSTYAVTQAAQIRVSDLAPTRVDGVQLPPQSFDVYPNPASRAIMLHLERPTYLADPTDRTNPTRLTISDLLGKVVFSASNGEIPSSVDLTPFPTGVYRFVLQEQGKTTATLSVVRN